MLGILSLLSASILTGIPAWILGRNALKDMDAEAANPNDRTIAKFGLVLGQHSVGLTVLCLLFFFLALPFIRGVMQQIEDLSTGGPSGTPRPPIERKK